MGSPQVRVISLRKILVDARDQPGPAARFHQAQDGNQQRAKPDQEELQHLVEDRGEQPAQGDVDRHGDAKTPKC